MNTENQISSEYTLLFNGITDTIKQLQEMIEHLRFMQQSAEELYMNRDN